MGHRAPAGPDAFWSRTVPALQGELGSGPGGLSEADAAERLARYGPNQPVRRRETSAWKLLVRQFVSPIELILIGATILSGLLGDWVDAGIILVILLASGLLSFVQERGAGRAMAELLASVAVTAQVQRDGAVVTVPVEEVVPGDVAVVSAGDLIPGDCLVLESTDLSVDESTLTGETFPVDKRVGVVPATTALGERTNAAFLGTHVASGRGRLLVVRTGTDTVIADLSAHLGSADPVTGFERGMTAFGLLLGRVMLVLVVAILLVNVALGRPAVDSVLFALALAVGITPQLLPTIVSVSLARGARQIATHRVITRRLDAIEDLGSMSILCSDKTGTMTRGSIEFRDPLDLEGRHNDAVAELATLNASLQTGLTNPIDAAIAAAHPVPPQAVALGEVPYDFTRKRLSVLVRPAPGADPLLITKGALEPILAVCTHAQTAAGVVPLADVLPAVRERFAALSGEGFRVLGLATRPLPGRDAPEGADEAELTLVGLLCFADPAKPDAAATLRDLAAAGISVRMLTGDNHLVAAHVAREVGLDATTVRTGADVDAADDRALAVLARDTQVFSELTPIHKERIVRALRADGSVVGYLGDGINDAPPLHAADVGISVDDAVPVAKQSAAIILLDKELGILLNGVREGRRTFANTMKYVYMTTSANFGNVVSMAFAAVVLPFLPLLAGQLLLINLLTDFPATTIATDRVDPEQIRTPQRWDVRVIRAYMITFGVVSTLFDLATFAVLRAVFHAGESEFQSAWFVGSILTELGVLFVLRTHGPALRSRPSTWIVWTSLAAVVVCLALPFSPVAPLLSLVAIPPAVLGAILLITLAYLLTNELVKRWFWRRFDAPATA